MTAAVTGTPWVGLCAAIRGVFSVRPNPYREVQAALLLQAISHLARLVGIDEQLRDDAVQDAFIKLSRVVPPRATHDLACRAWLAKVLSSIFTDRIRELTRRRQHIVSVGALNDLVSVAGSGDSHETAPETVEADGDVLTQVVAGVAAQLRGEIRENFLRDVRDLKAIAASPKHGDEVKCVATRDYGEVSKRTVNAIHVRMKRTRKRVREYVEGMEEPRRSRWKVAIQRVLSDGEKESL
jgi:DNA-directed RNA polymerase specialized sigma24 family protein